jgi:hypothetical protein
MANENTLDSHLNGTNTDAYQANRIAEVIAYADRQMQNSFRDVQRQNARSRQVCMRAKSYHLRL